MHFIPSKDALCFFTCLFIMASNFPDINNLSHLSPYLHYGHISPHRCALEASKCQGTSEAHKNSFESFFEEIVIRRELSDNYCYYNSKYDSWDGLPPWSKKTLIDHAVDTRLHTYTFSQLEKAKTHDVLWNTCQNEMVHSGKMHGYVRMYWCKKILEWSVTPQEALANAMRLNDKYFLDGRDPNGYVGCGWAIGGVHDRAFAEREIFGKVRYMSFEGCKRKFSIPKYAARIKKLVGKAHLKKSVF